MPDRLIQSWTEGSVGIIKLDRPEAANALNRRMVHEIVEQAEAYDQDSTIRVMIIQGSDKMFAAGADIGEMANEDPISFELADPFADWDRLAQIHKPLLAQVSGYALGGGFELALHCDVIVAADDALFGFPEVTLGVLPGAGGTQLLTRAAGRNKALQMIWSGEKISAREAERLGIVGKVAVKETLEEETRLLAEKLASQAPVALRLIKEAVDYAEDLSLKDGMKMERKNFYLTMATKDQKEGMKAFLEKRQPSFQGE
jgi:enoyl-CoA hydratase